MRRPPRRAAMRRRHSSGDENRGGMLQALLERLDHRGRVVTVHEAVVEGRGEVHGAPDGDGAAHDHRALQGAVHADDGHFRSVDDRRAGDAAQLAETGDGDGRTGQLFALRLVGARSLAHPAHLGRQIPQRERLGVVHHRHLEAVGSLRGDTQVHGPVPHDHAPLGVVVRIALWKILQHAHQRQRQERQIAQRRRTRRQRAVQMAAQGFELGDVEFLHVGEVRNVALRLAQALGNDAAQADHLDLFRGAARREARLAPSGATEDIKVIGLRRVIAQRLSEAKRNIPHFAYVEELDVTELEALRRHLNGALAPGAPALSYLPFLALALVRVLQDFPQCNAHYDAERGVIVRHRSVHLGVATQTTDGLKVPVVHDAQALTLWDLAAEMRRVSEAARTNKAKREELTGSTITITSLGKLGGIASTPIINAPEVAIIGVNRALERPVVVDGAIAIRRTMNLSSSFDHRFVDGYDAAAMIQALKERLEHPATILDRKSVV